ncbi:hypothetical protein, partial [Haloquadratum walsbyi]|uniref:hypothetical protein n=1 Tax=Haloquadratum walsbyi TaxID=293091 RepID=UPI001AD8C67F
FERGHGVFFLEASYSDQSIGTGVIFSTSRLKRSVRLPELYNQCRSRLSAMLFVQLSGRRALVQSSNHATGHVRE